MMLQKVRPQAQNADVIFSAFLSTLCVLSRTFCSFLRTPLQVLALRPGQAEPLLWVPYLRGSMLCNAI